MNLDISKGFRIHTSTRLAFGLLGFVLLATISGCKDPIPREAHDGFEKLSAEVKKRLNDILPERKLILVNFRTQCELQSSTEFPIVGRILVNYRGEDSPINKSNQLRLRYQFREKDQNWIYRDLNISREILEDLHDEDAMFEAILRVQPSKTKD